MINRLLLIGFCLLAAVGRGAELKLATLFSDHAVLQRDRPLPVWGWAEPGDEITVTLGTLTATTIAGSDRRWMVKLAPQPMSKQPLTLTVKGKNAVGVTVRDVLLGDVWLCGGQSNMEFGLGGCNAPDDVRGSDFPMIRHFGVAYNFASVPQTNVTGSWQVCTPRTAFGFTAVGYYFARKIHGETGVPTGLLRSCVGGTGIELWMSQETLLSTPALASYAQQMRTSIERYQRELADAIPSIEQWTSLARAAQQDGQPLPLPPAWQSFPSARRPCVPGASHCTTG